MKKTILTALAVFFAVGMLLSGCSDKMVRSAPTANGNSVEDVMNDQIDQTSQASSDAVVSQETSVTQAPESAPESQTFHPSATKTPELDGASADIQATDDVDIDLTVMSSTMVFGEVYNMMVSPEEYAGKTIKIEGKYYASYDESTDKYYHFVVIADATACCSQGMEFVWTGDHTYPDDYPENETEVEITGVFGLYEELGITYCHLTVDDIKVIK